MYNELLMQMSRHSAGLVGSPYPLDDFKDSMPNKLFEYVSAGLPVIVINSPEASKYVEENGLGVSIQDASEVGKALEELKGKSLLRERWKFTLEGEISSLVSLYEELCGKDQRVIAQV
jgi:glycosyltransferase involved in cell wall biosynthesis